MAQKRKLVETESSGSFSNKEMKPSPFPNLNPWPLQQQRAFNHVDDSNNTLLGSGGTAGHIYGYSLCPWVLHGTVAGSVHENAVGSMAGPVRGVLSMDGAGAGKSVKGGSYVGIQGGILVDHTPRSNKMSFRSVTWERGDEAVHDRLVSHTYAYTPSSYMRPTQYVEGSVGLPNTIASDTYRPPPYSGSTGSPNTIPSPYQFADTVQANELHQSSGLRAVDAVPSAALAHPSSSVYWKREFCTGLSLFLP
ncbi:putative sphinganine C(4)-monooxygenase 1-like [Capsicum annuum]|uniref:Uncharacterized protein n=1 Tax=Capsicum annuum TaxID=4072 RepID=A0A2G2ZQ38_CAPAN|nr:putative sphinganine C(4)-monooxygenase 1-like [Capsicum annuum]PHT84099.1 hypothetical protein T459_12542 [Capsicum annuum]